MTILSLNTLRNLVRRRAPRGSLFRRMACRLRTSTTRLFIILLSLLLLAGSFVLNPLRSSVLAGNNQDNRACGWYTVQAGDNLTTIASLYHTTISTLVSANGIQNSNLIFVGQRLCFPNKLVHNSGKAGITPSGSVRWYAYEALDWSNRSQVHDLLYQVAYAHHLPPRLLLAIAWQESGWTQHVIAWDGGIGVMQLMPYTAQSINAGVGAQFDPYSLWDNLNLGATYLQWLWQDFGGNLNQVISAYNEGGWSVRHRGIYNWSYVNNVEALMYRLG